MKDDNLLRPALDTPSPPSPPSPLRPTGGVLPMLMYGRRSGSSSIIHVSYTRVCCAPSATGRGNRIHDFTLFYSSVKCQFTLFCCCLWGGSAGGLAGSLHITITERCFIIEDARYKGNDISTREKQTKKTQPCGTPRPGEGPRSAVISQPPRRRRLRGKKEEYISMFSFWKRQEASKGP